MVTSWDCCKTPGSRHSSQHYRSLISVSEDNGGETKRRNRVFATVPMGQVMPWIPYERIPSDGIIIYDQRLMDSNIRNINKQLVVWNNSLFKHDLFNRRRGYMPMIIMKGGL